MTPLLRLGGKLIKAGLPADYVARMLRELEDHLNDMGLDDTDDADGSNSAACLGHVDEMSRHIVSEYRQTRWVGRAPLLGHTLLPAVLLFLVWNLYFVVTLLPVILLNADLNDYDWATRSIYQTHPLTVLLVTTIYFGGKVVPFALATWLFLRITKRSGRGPIWRLAAVVVMSIFAMFLVRTSISIPIAPGGEGLDFSLEIGNLEDELYHFGEQIAQGLTPVLIALAMMTSWLWSRKTSITLQSMRVGFARRSEA